MSIEPASGWNLAMTYDQYVAQMTTRQDEYIRNFDSAEIRDADRELLGAMTLRFLILTEDWCIDSAQFVPVVARLAHEVTTIDIRFLLRNEHADLADGYRDRTGRQPIPVIIMLDEDGNEIGALLERPAAVTEMMAQETRRFASENDHIQGIRRAYASMPPGARQAVSDNMRSWRTRRKDEFARILLDDLASILAAHPA